MVSARRLVVSLVSCKRSGRAPRRGDGADPLELFPGCQSRRDLGHSSSPNNSPQAPTQDKFHLCSPEDRPRDGGGRSSPGVQVCEGGKALERMVMGVRGCLSELWRGGKGHLPQGCEQGVKRLFLDFCPSFLPNFPLPPLRLYHSLSQTECWVGLAECWVGLAEQTRTLTVPSSIFTATRGTLSCLKGCVRQKSPEQHFTNLLGTWVQCRSRFSTSSVSPGFCSQAVPTLLCLFTIRVRRP